ncbi:MAG TPA: hypothetical protein VNS09_11595 [Solirubrobacter sp.]|nr:hypothetical protein [Solirubrobacter sp.]
MPATQTHQTSDEGRRVVHADEPVDDHAGAYERLKITAGLLEQ